MADRMAGRVLNGRYELQSLLGGGGMALVYRARDQVLNRTVAVKVLREQYASDPTFQQRFTREAQAAGSLAHPNIVSVYDVGRDGDLPYIVMEYVPGRTLRDILNQDPVLPVDQAVNIAAGILNALEYAHRNGLIHRDIKPGNILITPQGTVKVVDFGIAKSASDLSLTGAGMALGTAAYFSPEQARGEGARVQSDLYSVGATLYEMLTGRPPFDADTDVGIAYKHINEPPVPPRRLNPAIPPQLEAIILHALAKTPAQRFGSAAEMESALRNYAAFGAQATAAVPMVPPRPLYQTAAPPPTTVARPAPVVRPARSGGMNSACLTWVLGGVALLLLLGGAVMALTGGLRFAGAEPTPDTGGQPTVVLPTLQAIRTPAAATATLPPLPTQTPAPSPTPFPTVTPIVLALVPDLTNRPLADAQAAAGGLGLKVNVAGQQNDSEHPQGTIISQDPAPNTRVNPGTVINVVVSKGPLQIAMPNVINTNGSEAQGFLSKAPFNFVVTVQQENSTVPEGVVTRQQPDPGTSINVGSSVTIWVSAGDKVTVPNVVGQDQNDAVAALQAAGLDPQVSTVARELIPGLPKNIKPGQVGQTDPAAGTVVNRNSPVGVLVVADKK